MQLRSEVIGQVTELHVEEADQVKKGDPLITLEPKTYQAQVEQAEARVRIQQIAIERQRLLIKTLADRFERQKSMFSQNLIDEDSYEALESELALSKVDLRSLQESLAQSRAALDQAEELLSKTRIKSPIDGLVIQVDIKEGETVIAQGDKGGVPLQDVEYPRVLLPGVAVTAMGALRLDVLDKGDGVVRPSRHDRRIEPAAGPGDPVDRAPASVELGDGDDFLCRLDRSQCHLG